MDATLRMIANLTGRITSQIRLSFGVIPWMTPKRVLDMSYAVGVVILDHVGRIHDVRAIRDEEGRLALPATGQQSQREAGRWVQLEYNEGVDIILPEGRKVSILLSCPEPGEQLPEVDIKFDGDLILNCFGAGLRPAKTTEHGSHVLEGQQVIVPLDSPPAPRTVPCEGVGASSSNDK